MAIRLKQRPTMSANDTEVVSVNYNQWLDSGELLTGTPTVVEVTTSALTLGSKAVNTTALVVLGRNVAVGEAVQFTVTTATTGVYTIRITASTDASPARTAVRDLELTVV